MYRENNEIYKSCFCFDKNQIRKTDKEGNETIDTISYKIKFIDSMRLMTISLSKLIDNLTEGIHKMKYVGCGCSLKCESIKNNFIKYICLFCNKDNSRKPKEKLKEKFKSKFKFSNCDINKFILSLRKGIYPHEYMDS